MNFVSYTELRNNLATLMDKVNNDHVPIMITRQNGKPAVLLSADDFRGYEETAYLLSNPVNAARLREAITDIEAGKVEYHDLLEVDEDEDQV